MLIQKAGRSIRVRFNEWLEEQSKKAGWTLAIALTIVQSIALVWRRFQCSSGRDVPLNTVGDSLESLSQLQRDFKVSLVPRYHEHLISILTSTKNAFMSQSTKMNVLMLKRYYWRRGNQCRNGVQQLLFWSKRYRLLHFQKVSEEWIQSSESSVRFLFLVGSFSQAIQIESSVCSSQVGSMFISAWLGSFSQATQMKSSIFSSQVGSREFRPITLSKAVLKILETLIEKQINQFTSSWREGHSALALNVKYQISYYVWCLSCKIRQHQGFSVLSHFLTLRKLLRELLHAFWFVIFTAIW
jgi:hypothetical protein